MDRLLLENVFRANLASIRAARKLVEQVVCASVFEAALKQKIVLCLSEIITNIVMHSCPAASEILVRFKQQCGNWVLEVQDDGQLFNTPKITDSVELGACQDRVGGRGIKLIQASCDDMKYSVGEYFCNCLILSWPVHKQGERTKILLVEDSAPMRRLYREYLRVDYTVYLAENGSEALNVLEQKEIDLVLSDINMPTMDGLSLRVELARSRETELIPFIFLTASEKQDLQARATSLGIDDYISKPVSGPDLIQHIERVLQRTRQVVQRLTNRLDRKISESFIPDLPSLVNRWSIAVEGRNTGSGGGDLLMHHNTEDAAQVVLIDTMGHDEASKFYAYAYGGLITGLMRSNRFNQCQGLLQQISAMAYNDELLSKITLTGVVIDLAENGQLRIASAAHPYPLLVTRDQVRPVQVEGMLPGLLADIRFSPINVQLRPGERIVFYTDGLFESAADNVARKSLEDEIIVTMQHTMDLPIDRAARIIMQKFDEIAGIPARDDATLVLMEPEWVA
ncbi:MAG: response regulator [Gammaproteobacteria bacterium]|nr:response regulator [Gammaproteobacteria bacterium]